MSYKNSITTAIISLFLWSMFSCADENASLLDKDRFINITTDLMIIEKLNLDESGKILLTKDVFKQYNISARQYEQTKEFYKDDPYFWADVYKQVQIRLKDVMNKKKETAKK